MVLGSIALLLIEGFPFEKRRVTDTGSCGTLEYFQLRLLYPKGRADKMRPASLEYVSNEAVLKPCWESRDLAGGMS